MKLHIGQLDTRAVSALQTVDGSSGDRAGHRAGKSSLTKCLQVVVRAGRDEAGPSDTRQSIPSFHHGGPGPGLSQAAPVWVGTQSWEG